MRSADFVRVLARAPCARSAHFAVHFLEDRPSGPGPVVRRLSPRRPASELSTSGGHPCARAVDDCGAAKTGAAWLGAVVPKRHARRAVTRSLMKRQVRAAAERLAGATTASADAASAASSLSPPAAGDGLPGGLWIVRLRAPFARDAFPSAVSDALRTAVRAELDALLAAAVRRCGGGSGGGAARPAGAAR